MRQLTCTGPGALEWRDVPEPQLDDAQSALIRPIAVARCEIDPLLIASGPRDASGYAVGHESVAEVIGVGSEVSDIRPGDLVVPSFQLCCGRCESCRKGRSANCDAYAVLSDYGMQPLSGAEYGGMLSDEVRVPHADAMLFPLPPNVDPVSVASAGDNLADGREDQARSGVVPRRGLAARQAEQQEGHQKRDRSPVAGR